MIPAQDAGDRARLLEAPSPLILVAVLVSPWLWRQRREACVALRAILARLIPPVSLARLILPAVLMRPVAPLLAWALVVPVSSAASSSSAITSVVALGASIEAPVAEGPELLTVVGLVAVNIMEDAERPIALG